MADKKTGSDWPGKGSAEHMLAELALERRALVLQFVPLSHVVLQDGEDDVVHPTKRIVALVVDDEGYAENRDCKTWTHALHGEQCGATAAEAITEALKAYFE